MVPAGLWGMLGVVTMWEGRGVVGRLCLRVRHPSPFMLRRNIVGLVVHHLVSLDRVCRRSLRIRTRMITCRSTIIQAEGMMGHMTRRISGGDIDTNPFFLNMYTSLGSQDDLRRKHTEYNELPTPLDLQGRNN